MRNNNIIIINFKFILIHVDTATVAFKGLISTKETH